MKTALLNTSMCQRPKRAFIISTQKKLIDNELINNVCQRPKRAFIISTYIIREIMKTL